jgi:hypothetical protein
LTQKLVILLNSWSKNEKEREKEKEKKTNNDDDKNLCMPLSLSPSLVLRFILIRELSIRKAIGLNIWVTTVQSTRPIFKKVLMLRRDVRVDRLKPQGYQLRMSEFEDTVGLGIWTTTTTTDCFKTFWWRGERLPEHLILKARSFFCLQMYWDFFSWDFIFYMEKNRRSMPCSAMWSFSCVCDWVYGRERVCVHLCVDLKIEIWMQFLLLPPLAFKVLLSSRAGLHKRQKRRKEKDIQR